MIMTWSTAHCGRVPNQTLYSPHHWWRFWTHHSFLALWYWTPEHQLMVPQSIFNANTHDPPTHRVRWPEAIPHRPPQSRRAWVHWARQRPPPPLRTAGYWVAGTWPSSRSKGRLCKYPEGKLPWNWSWMEKTPDLQLVMLTVFSGRLWRTSTVRYWRLLLNQALVGGRNLGRVD